MSANQASFGVAITADDRTAKGVNSANKRVGTVASGAARANRIAAEASERSWRRSGFGMVRTFGQVERASARAFGGSSITSGIAGRLGAVREAASAAGAGLGEAATAGGLLSGALGTIGVVAGATVGVLAAAGYAAFKLVDGWAKGAATIGRMADTIGVAKKELQEFTAAAERAGVDKGAAAGTLGSLSQTLNDARYGRNRDAIGVLAKLGVGMKLNADGTVNVGAMLPAIADAIARQNSSGRRTAARALGISTEALPAFTQGGAALSADMQDADRTAYIASDADIARAQRIARKGARVGQLKDLAIGASGSAAADLAEPGYDVALRTGTNLVTGSANFGAVVSRSFKPGAESVERGGKAIERAANGSVSMQRYLGAVARVESGGNRFAKAPTSSALGLYQFTEGTWLSMMERHGASHGLGWAADAIHGGRVRDPAMRARILAMRTDAGISTKLAADLAADNTPALAAALGHAPGPGDLYMGNFLGSAGASRFFRAERRNPGSSAAALFPREAAANRSIFFDHGRERSLGEVHELMNRKIEIALKIEGLPPGTRAKASSGHSVAISRSPVGQPWWSTFDGILGQLDRDVPR